jgi:tetratricopeptide (TPR) repeat protein
MKFSLYALLILFISPLMAIGQTPEKSIHTEGELVSALCGKEIDEGTSESLLKSYPQFINTDLWTQLNKEAVAAYYGQSPHRSISIYKVALQVASQLGDPKLLGATYYSIGRTYSGLNKFEDAIESYEKSRAYFERAGLPAGLANVLADLGALYLIQENYAKAKDYSERSLNSTQNLKTNSTNDTSADGSAWARALLTLGEIDSRDGNHTQALEKLKQSLRLYQRLSRESPSYAYYVAGAYGAIGRLYPDVGDYAQALSYFSKGLEIAKAASYSNLLSSFRNDIGVLYLEQEDYEQAKAQFVEGIKICEAEKNQNQEVRLLLNLGVVEQRKGNLDESLRYFRLSLRIAEAISMSDFQIAAWEGIGVVLTERREFEAASDALNRGLAIARRMSDKARQTELLWRMAQTRYEMGRLPEAVSLAEEAIALGRASRASKLIYLATTTLGELYAAQNKIALAEQTLKGAVEQLESIRDHVGGNELEAEHFLENKTASYYSLVSVLLKQGKTFDALMYAERAKGRVLLDVLRTAKPDSAKVLTSAEKAEEQRLNRRISEVNDTIRQATNASSLSSLYTQLDTARLEFQSFQDSLYANHPELKMRGGETSLLTSADVKSFTAQASTAFLEYAVAKDHVFLFVLTKGKSSSSPDLKVYPINVGPDELLGKVNDFHDALANQSLAYAGGAHELYSILVAPAEEQIKNAIPSASSRTHFSGICRFRL